MYSADHKTTYFQKVLVRSRDRLNFTSTSPSNFKTTYTEVLEGKHAVRWITIPNSLYNINSTNNQFYYDIGAGNVLVTLSAGNYTGQTLAVALQSLIPASTVVFEPLYSKLRVTRAAGVTLTPVTAQKVMGLQLNLAPTVIAPAAATYLPNTVDLSVPLSLGIMVRESGGPGYVTGGSPNRQGTLIVPMLASFSLFNFLSDESDHKQFLSFPTGVKQLSIEVVDPSTGVTVDLNGVDWEMMIERVEHYETPNKRPRHE